MIEKPLLTKKRQNLKYLLKLHCRKKNTKNSFCSSITNVDVYLLCDPVFFSVVHFFFTWPHFFQPSVSFTSIKIFKKRAIRYVDSMKLLQSIAYKVTSKKLTGALCGMILVNYQLLKCKGILRLHKETTFTLFLH